MSVDVKQEEAMIPKFLFDSLKDSQDSYRRRTDAEIAALESKLNQMLELIHGLQSERDNAEAQKVETRRELECEKNTTTWLQDQCNTLKAKAEYTIKENEWMSDVANNPSFDPAKKAVLDLLYPLARKGEWFRVPVCFMSKKAGMKYYGTFSGHMKDLADLGYLEVRDGEEAWFKGYDKNGKPKFRTDIVIRFSEELLRFPGEVHIEKEDKRKGNGKGGGKNAKPKACPECKSMLIDELDKCKCRACNHEWEDGPAKDANRNAKVTPWDYGQVEEDAEKLRKEEEAQETQEAPTTLFPDMDKPKPQEVPPSSKEAYDGPTPPPDRACFECQSRGLPKNWQWDESIENYVCVNDHSKKGAA